MTNKDKEVLLLLSQLLRYPENIELQLDQLRTVVSVLPNSPAHQNISQFLEYLESNEWEQLADNYVTTFDFTQDSNLYLTSLIYNDDRKRGQLLADLKSIYCQAELEVDTDELPDYLPLLLEFLSVANAELCSQVLGIVGSGMEKLWQQLAKKHSPYAGLLETCLLTLGLRAFKVNEQQVEV